MLKALLVLLCSTCLLKAADPRVDFGAENDGLRLKLEIRSADAPKDEHSFKLTIKNVGPTDRTFISKLIKREGGFEKYVQSSVTFETVPFVVPSGFGIGTKKADAPDTLTIKSGAEWASEWTVAGRKIVSHEAQWSVHFPTSGRFELKALLQLTDDKSRGVKLISNPAPLLVGGNFQNPKACAAQIVSTDERRQKVVLKNIGTEAGSKVGDVFRLDYPKRGFFFLELETVTAEGAIARVIKENLYQPDHKGVFFQAGDWAGLVPEDEQKQ